MRASAHKFHISAKAERGLNQDLVEAMFLGRRTRTDYDAGVSRRVGEVMPVAIPDRRFLATSQRTAFRWLVHHDSRPRTSCQRKAA